jgi:pyridoxal 5'-phosphate synthase pdxS subunit
VVAVKQGNLMATCFHPEISSDDSWLRVFLNDICKAEAEPIADVPDVDVAAPWSAVNKAKEGEFGYGSTAVKRAFAVFQKGGVIMDVVNGEQARIAEEAGCVAVMALERIPADIKADGGVARSSDPSMITDVMNSCSVPVMAKSRIGHFYESKILQALDVDCIDESEVLTAADEQHHIDKRSFDIPFVCGAQDLGEALRRIAEGAALIRLKGNAGTGNVIQAVRHARSVFSEIRAVQAMRDDELFCYAKDLRVPVELVQQVKAAGRLPVVTFAAGGLATPADVALLMELGCDGVFVGSGIFKGENPAARARAMVAACTHYKSPETVARVSENLGKAMIGLLEHESGPEVAARLALQGRIGVDPSVAA